MFTSPRMLKFGNQFPNRRLVVNVRERDFPIEVKLVILAEQMIKRFQILIAFALTAGQFLAQLLAIREQFAAELLPFLALGGEIGGTWRASEMCLEFPGRRRQRLSRIGHDGSFRYLHR